MPLSKIMKRKVWEIRFLDIFDQYIDPDSPDTVNISSGARKHLIALAKKLRVWCERSFFVLFTEFEYPLESTLF